MIGYLADKRKAAFLDEDDEGRRPMHLAAEKAPLDVVALLVDKCPEALMTKNGNGELPIHVAVEEGNWNEPCFPKI